MELYKELPLDLQLKIFDTYKKERYMRKKQMRTIIFKKILMEEFNFYADTFSNGIEWDVNLFMFVRRWERENDDSVGWQDG
jgi:hypothetical protein